MRGARWTFGDRFYFGNFFLAIGLISFRHYPVVKEILIVLCLFRQRLRLLTSAATGQSPESLRLQPVSFEHQSVRVTLWAFRFRLSRFLFRCRHRPHHVAPVDQVGSALPVFWHCRIAVITLAVVIDGIEQKATVRVGAIAKLPSVHEIL